MPFAELKDVRIRYELDGPENVPVLMFSNSLGADVTMWTPQLPAFSKDFRILRYDKRGHGQSSVTPGPYTIEQLGKDVVALLDSLQIDRVNFCGLSMGGSTGLWLGLNAPQRLTKLVLCNTGAKIGNAEGWNTRIETVRKSGMKGISAGVMERWFTAKFREAEPAQVDRVQKVLEGHNPEGYVACCAAVRDFDCRELVAGIHTPTLVIAGSHDPATPPALGHFLAEKISGARCVELDASHISNMEQPERFTAELRRFLAA
jgi:3-oxoadipate enol-lactonase